MRRQGLRGRVHAPCSDAAISLGALLKSRSFPPSQQESKGLARSGSRATNRSIGIAMRDARSIMSQAIAAGKLVRRPCRDCGVTKVHGHHTDYTKPLDVTWLCPQHHRQEHIRLQRLGVEIPGRETLARAVSLRFIRADHRIVKALKQKLGVHSTTTIIRLALRALAVKEGVSI